MLKKAISLIMSTVMIAASAQAVFADAGKGNGFIISNEELSESYVNYPIDSSVFEQTKTVSEMSADCSTEILPMKNKYVLSFDLKLLEASADGKTLIFWFGKGGNNETARDKITVNPSADSITWNEYDKRGSSSESMTYEFSDDTSAVYNVYVSKNGTDFVFGIKGENESEYNYLHETSAESENGSFSARTRGFTAEISDLKFHTEKPAEPMPEIEQSVLDADYDVTEAKDSLFNNGDTYSISNGKTTSYEGLTDNSVIKMTMKPAVSADTWQYMRIYLGENETISFNHSTDKIDYKITKTEIQKSIDYDFVNDGATAYNVYISKINNTLVFGIKRSGDTSYSWFSIDNAVNDRYKTLKVGTNGYLVNISNAYVYTLKKPMPEVPEAALNEKYDKTDITSSFSKCAETDYTQAGDDIASNPTFSGISDGDVIKFNLTGKTAQNESWHWFRILLGKSETFIIDQKAKTLTYTNSKDTALKTVLNFDFTNDTETVYNMYIEKTNGNLVFGIKKSDQSSYTWAQIDNSPNEDYSFLRMRTFGFPVTVSNAYLYAEKGSDIPYEMNLSKNIRSGNAEIILDIMRLNNKAKSSGVLVTAVYTVENGAETLYSIKFSDEKSILKKEYTNFVNTVPVPSDREYTLENYLWGSYSDFSPITEIK